MSKEFRPLVMRANRLLGAQLVEHNLVKIEDRDIEVLPVETLERFARRPGGDDFVAFVGQQEPERVQDVGLVIGDQDANRCGVGHRNVSNLYNLWRPARATGTSRSCDGWRPPNAANAPNNLPSNEIFPMPISTALRAVRTL